MPIKLIYPSILYRFPKWAKINADSSQTDRYSLIGGSIVWDKNTCKKPLPLFNHVEMSGLKASVIFSYGVNEDCSVRRYIYGIFPKLRLYPNNTHSSLGYKFKPIKIEGKHQENAEKISFNGILNILSSFGNLKVLRALTAAKNAMAVVEKITVSNSGNDIEELNIVNEKPYGKVSKIFMHGNSGHKLNVGIFNEGKIVYDKTTKIKVKPQETKAFYVAYSAEASQVDAAAEFLGRENFLADMDKKLTITTPDSVVNQMLSFTKVRACESIFDTKGGYMHAPGGGGFYAAMWTNDQCEYANPYFAYTGYDIAKLSAINSFEWFGKFVKPDQAIVSSIVAEGDSVWHGAGDRGDNAMYVYGLTRYIMTTGDKHMAAEYIDKLIMATEFFVSKINSDGVVESDADELENRFESGKANLSTSCIAYDALKSMGYLLNDLSMKDIADKYFAIAEKLKDSIGKYFGRTVEGYETYKYCKEEAALRSWVCLPLTVGIYDRAEGSIAAIMSDKLLKGNGILTRSGEKTYWDRSGLYALKGMFMAGYADKALNLLLQYSKARLLGEHAPYPVEAYPEGNGAHLSAESALYQRIFTEGVLGYRPVGLNKYQLSPSLPSSWKNFSIKNMELCGNLVNIEVEREEQGYTVTINGKEFKTSFGCSITLNC